MLHWRLDKGIIDLNISDYIALLTRIFILEVSFPNICRLMTPNPVAALLIFKLSVNSRHLIVDFNLMVVSSIIRDADTEFAF